MARFSNERLIELEKQAFAECCSDKTTAHHGGEPGRPFWNAYANQFMYVPAFQFTHIPGCTNYLFKAFDEAGNEYSFNAEKSTALLTPIWDKLPEGVVRLTVTALLQDGRQYEIGARTFFRLAPFTADLPKASCSYEEAIDKAFNYVMKQEFVFHWLREGTPDPSYDLNVYPCKMISSIVKAMVSYAKVRPDKKDMAMQIAENAAEYLLSITPDGTVPLPYLPPTYSFKYCPDPVKYGFDKNGNWEQANIHKDTTMIIYPASAGDAFLIMYEQTGDEKYLTAAKRIGEFFDKHVEENGGWKVTWSEITGEPAADNYADPLPHICPYLLRMYKVTGDDKWKKLADGAFSYVEKALLPTYNWEGQFEDSVLSVNYSNLTHFGADSLIEYYAEYYPDDEERMKVAEDLARFVEDQFVVWHQAPPWYDIEREWDTKLWHTPGVLEQYHWYMPIDSSTGRVAQVFLSMYKAGRGDLYLAKAICLMDQLLITQDDEGQIPTHWVNCEEAKENFWMNCMFASMEEIAEMAEYVK